MRRIMLVLTAALVMAAMMVAMAIPAFAQATRTSFEGTFKGEPCAGDVVFTPSGNINVKCQIKSPGGNEGGSGGGGATVEEGTGFISGQPVDVHTVITPSGNGTLQGHFHP
jgi:hypothetical protein